MQYRHIELRMKPFGDQELLESHQYRLGTGISAGKYFENTAKVYGVL
jgi:hypothetical protein